MASFANYHVDFQWCGILRDVFFFPDKDCSSLFCLNVLVNCQQLPDPTANLSYTHTHRVRERRGRFAEDRVLHLNSQRLLGVVFSPNDN